MACAINTIAGNLIKWTLPSQNVVKYYDVYRVTADVTAAITTADIIAKVSFGTNLFFDCFTENTTYWYRLKSRSWSDKSSSLSLTISATKGSILIDVGSADLTLNGNNINIGTACSTITMEGKDIILGASTGDFTVNSEDINIGTACSTITLEGKSIAINGTGNVTINVCGNITLDADSIVCSTLTVTGNVCAGGTLYVCGATTFGNDLTVCGSLTVCGGLTYCGNLTVGGNLVVCGNTTLTGPLEASSTVSIDGATSIANTLHVSGAATFGSTVNISGAVSLASTLHVCGNTTISGTLSVGGPSTFSNLSNFCATTSFIEGVVLYSALQVKDFIQFTALAADPAAVDGIRVYGKDTGGLTKLMYVDSAGTTYQVPSAGGYSSSEDIVIGTPTDTDWTDGVHSWSTTTTVADALDDCNETLSYLAPDDAGSLAGNLTASGTTKYKARLSSGGGQNYKDGQTAGDTTSAVITDCTFTLRHINSATTFNKADEGYTRWYKAVGTATYSVQNTIIHTAAFNETNRTGSQSASSVAAFSSGALSVTYVGMYNSFPKWQRGNAEIAITSALLSQGYNKIKMTRECGFTTQESNDYEVWVDSQGSTPVIGTAHITEDTGAFRWLSGVKMYWKGSTWDVSLAYASAWCDNVYDDVTIFRITSTDSLLGNDTSIDYDDAGVTGASTPPAIGDTLYISAFATTTTNSASRSMDARLRITCYNAYGSSDTADTPSSNIMVDTTDSTSTTVYEYFDDENYRVPDTIDFDCADYTLTGLWTSTAALTDGDAQVWNGVLQFPSIDFTAGYLPTGQTADYSGFTTAGQTYYRAFYEDGGTPHSEGQIELGNIGSADVAAVSATGNVHVEIKLPGETGWLDLGKPYDGGTFSGSDGDGCRSSQTGDDWYWTVGATASTTNSGDRYYIKITLYTTSVTLTQVRELGW